MYCTFYLSYIDWDYFYAGKFPGNVSFRIVIASPFSICSMSNFLSNCYKEITEDISHVFYVL